LKCLLKEEEVNVALLRRKLVDALIIPRTTDPEEDSKKPYVEGSQRGKQNFISELKLDSCCTMMYRLVFGRPSKE
jgi:hypothetical protein